VFATRAPHFGHPVPRIWIFIVVSSPLLPASRHMRGQATAP
jgi:hypothetical protein